MKVRTLRAGGEIIAGRSSELKDEGVTRVRTRQSRSSHRQETSKEW